MSRPGVRARGNFAQDTVTTEFTTGQIVIMACVALAAACTMFALGVLVGRYDPTDPPKETVAATETPNPEVEPATPSVPSVKVAEKAVEPASKPAFETVPAVSPAAPAEAEPAKKAAAAPVDVAKEESKPEESKPVETVVASASPAPTTGTLSETVKPRVTRVEPLPLGGTGASGAPRVTRVEPLPGTAASPEPVKITPSEPSAAKKDAPPEPVEEPELMEAMPAPATKVASNDAAKEPAKPADAKKPEEAAKPEDAKKVVAAGPPSGKYGIQIASFTGSAGKSKAADYAARIKSTLGYDARVSPSPDGKVFRVVIGGYGDKGAAQEACNELKDMAGFKDAFVKVL